MAWITSIFFRLWLRSRAIVWHCGRHIGFPPFVSLYGIARCLMPCHGACCPGNHAQIMFCANGQFGWIYQAVKRVCPGPSFRFRAHNLNITWEHVKRPTLSRWWLKRRIQLMVLTFGTNLSRLTVMRIFVDGSRVEWELSPGQLSFKNCQSHVLQGPVLNSKSIWRSFATDVNRNASEAGRTSSEDYA